MKLSKPLAAALVCMAAAVAHARVAGLPFVDAEVRKVDPPRGTIVLKHGDIPNLAMPAMTMEFRVERKLAEGVKPGDKVRFQADMVGGYATVVTLVAAKK